MSHSEKTRVIYSREEIETLVRAAKQGDHKAFEKLYVEFLTPVYRYVFVRTNNKEASEDIVQTVFLKWYEALPKYELETSPLQYLFVIARRTLIDASRKKDSQSPVSLDEDTYDTLSDDTDFVEDLDTHMTTEEIMRHVETLSPREQEIIHLYFFAERTTQEIAALLELEEAHVRQIKKRALDRLRALASHLHDNL